MPLGSAHGRGDRPIASMHTASWWTELKTEIKMVDQGRAALGDEMGDKHWVHQ
jgi:hypothetical protein